MKSKELIHLFEKYLRVPGDDEIKKEGEHFKIIDTYSLERLRGFQVREREIYFRRAEPLQFKNSIEEFLRETFSCEGEDLPVIYRGKLMIFNKLQMISENEGFFLREDFSKGKGNLSCENEIMKFIERVFSVFEKYRRKIYIVGGAVRDMLLGRKIRDVDFLIPWMNFNEVREIIHCAFGSYPRGNEQFKTFTVKRSFSDFDFSMMREEVYPEMGSFPRVRRGSIRTDILRRDFPVNALLLDSSFNIYDFTGGLLRMREKTIDPITTVSFLEDPTRIMRGLRFSEELNFRISSTFKRLMDDALQKRLFEKIEGHRIFAELKLSRGRSLFKIFKTFCESKVWSQMGLDFLENDDVMAVIEEEKEKVEDIEGLLRVMGKAIKRSDAERLCERMKLSKRYNKILKGEFL